SALRKPARRPPISRVSGRLSALASITPTSGGGGWVGASSPPQAASRHSERTSGKAAAVRSIGVTCLGLHAAGGGKVISEPSSILADWMNGTLPQVRFAGGVVP